MPIPALAPVDSEDALDAGGVEVLDAINDVVFEDWGRDVVVHEEGCVTVVVAVGGRLTVVSIQPPVLLEVGK